MLRLNFEIKKSWWPGQFPKEGGKEGGPETDNQLCAT